MLLDLIQKGKEANHFWLTSPCFPGPATGNKIFPYLMALALRMVPNLAQIRDFFVETVKNRHSLLNIQRSNAAPGL